MTSTAEAIAGTRRAPALGFTPTSGSELVLIDNQPTNPLHGAFAGVKLLPRLTGSAGA